VALDDPAADGELHPGAGVVLARVEALEQLEDAVGVVGGQPAVIAAAQQLEVAVTIRSGSERSWEATYAKCSRSASGSCWAVTSANETTTG